MTLLRTSAMAALSLAFALPCTGAHGEVEAMIRAADRTGREMRASVSGVVTADYWAKDDSRLVFRVSEGRRRSRFSSFDPEAGKIRPAFDHAALAEALAEAAGRDVDAGRLPLEEVVPADEGADSFSFQAFDRRWTWHARDGLMEAGESRDEPEARSGRGRGRGARSPDGGWTARIDDHNLFLHPADGGKPVALTDDGTEAHPYSGPFHWAPDSGALVAWRAREVETRRVSIVQAAPPDQLQPELHQFDYAKPGDEIRQPMPRLFRINEENGHRELTINESLFANPWSNHRTWWSADGRFFEFLHNRRGHQLLRMIRLCARSGESTVVVEETSPTFIDYSQKTWFHRLGDGDRMLWMSERDGHNHILLIESATGEVVRRVTRGEWNVRRVLEVDEEARELLVETIGMDARHPYHSHFARVSIDSDRLVRLTEAPGHHTIRISPGGRWITATWSRPDHPPVTEVRDASSGNKNAEIGRADISRAEANGWLPPERFVAKGRDGETDIHGLIYRPRGFDPELSYPVVEHIYAGPHGFFVPQSFQAWNGNMRMAHHGFVIVKIDGMGTNWRNKAFHDVAWKNLADSGFPDRIAWIRAAARDRPWMDLGRVGIYGGSAGGQSTAAALLHHGHFYHTGVADCGCHDNRMDKIWWNEAWMGWPVDESYVQNSNATHAANLKGNLMLIVGEMDRNVDPASTDQLAAALQEEGKLFEYVKIFNAGHGAAETRYGNLVRTGFLLRHLGGPEQAAED